LPCLLPRNAAYSAAYPGGIKSTTQEGKPKRPKGTGSVYVRDGVVIGQYEVRTPEGEIRRRYVRDKDKKEVAGRLAKADNFPDSETPYTE